MSQVQMQDKRHNMQFKHIIKKSHSTFVVSAKGKWRTFVV